MIIQFEDVVFIQAMLDFLFDLGTVHPSVKETLEKHNEWKKLEKVSSDLWNEIEKKYVEEKK